MVDFSNGNPRQDKINVSKIVRYCNEGLKTNVLQVLDDFVIGVRKVSLAILELLLTYNSNIRHKLNSVLIGAGLCSCNAICGVRLQIQISGHHFFSLAG